MLSRMFKKNTLIYLFECKSNMLFCVVRKHPKPLSTFSVAFVNHFAPAWKLISRQVSIQWIKVAPSVIENNLDLYFVCTCGRVFFVPK